MIIRSVLELLPPGTADVIKRLVVLDPGLVNEWRGAPLSTLVELGVGGFVLEAVVAWKKSAKGGGLV